jgi:hypothetical protein
MRYRFACLTALIVSTPAAHGQTAPPHWTLVEELRIDGNAADLVPIQWMDVAANGTIAVSQPQDKAVKFFSPTGQLLSKFGRAGEGPGEFQDLNRLGWLGDTAWVLDARLQRLTYISPQRTFLRSVPVQQARPAPTDAARLPVMSFLHPDAVYSGGYILTSAQTTVDQQATPSGVTNAFLRLSADGVIQRVVAQIPRSGGTVDIRTPGGGMVGGGVPFFASDLRDPASDGSRIAFVSTTLTGRDANTFRVTVIGAMGDTIFSRAYPFTPVPIPSALFDSAVSARIVRAQVPELKSYYRSVDKPSAYPPVLSVMVGRDGTIWLRLRAIADGRPWLVLDEKGNPIGSLMLSAKQTGIAVADRHNVWTTDSDADGVQSIVRYQVSGG